MRKATFRASGQDSAGPNGVDAQSWSRIGFAIPPFPTKMPCAAVPSEGSWERLGSDVNAEACEYRARPCISVAIRPVHPKTRRTFPPPFGLFSGCPPPGPPTVRAGPAA